MSWKEGDFDPHGGRNAFMYGDENRQSSSERAASMRAMRSFTQSIEDDVGPPELPPSLDIDMMEGVSMKTSDTNDTIIEVKTKVDPQLGETQKYKMAVPGPGHSEQEQELHKSLIRDEEEDAEVEQVFSASSAPPTSLNFTKEDDKDISEKLRHAYDQKIRKRPTTPTSACVLDGIAFFAPTSDQTEQNESVSDTEKIKVSIPTRRRKTENMSYSDFYDSMASQIPAQGRRMSGSGRTTPINDYDGDILDENPNYRDKAPPAPVVHRRSSIEWENFADMEEKMEQAERKISEENKLEKEEEQEEIRKKELELKKSAKNADEETIKKKNTKDSKKLAFYAKPPTVEITSPDAPHLGAFHDQDAKSKQAKVLEETEEETAATEAEDDDLPTFSEDMDEERQKLQEEAVSAPVAENHEQEKPDSVEKELTTGTETEVVPESAEYDVNAYPGYIWNYDTQQWDVDPNYVHPEGAYDQTGYDHNTYDTSAYAYDQAGYDQSVANQTGYDYSAYHAGYNQNQYDPSTYDHTAYSQFAYDQSSHDQNTGYDQAQNHQTSYDTTAYNQDSSAVDQTTSQQYAEDDPSQQYDYSAYGGYEGYLEACKAYEQQTLTNNHEGYAQNGDDTYAAYGDSYQGYGGETYYGAQDESSNSYDHSPYSQNEQSFEGQAESTVETLKDEPVRPIVTQPLFKQAPPSADPYAWDAQDATPSQNLDNSTQNEIHVEDHHSETKAPARPPPARPEAPKKSEESSAPPRPPPATKTAPARPAPATRKEPEKTKEPEPEEDAWTQFKKMTEKVSDLVKTTETTLTSLKETSATNDMKDESYLSQIGGSQGFVNDSTQREIQRLTDEKKMEKIQKKKLKQQGKKVASPTLDPDEEDAMDRAAQELAMKIASTRTDIGDWQAPIIPEKPKKIAEIVREDSASAIPPRKRSSIKDVQQDSGGSLELPPHLAAQQIDSVVPKGDLAPDDPILSAPAWADFDTSDPVLPPSESGFFSNKDASNEATATALNSDSADPFVIPSSITLNKSSTSTDPFAPQQPTLIDESYDPFAVVAVEEVVAMAKAKAEQAAAAAASAENEDDFYNGRHSPTLSTPTPEGGSPLSARPNQFDDDFKCEMTGLDTPTPLYDEDDSQPLTDFLPKFAGDGWDLMVRHPIKKKSFMAERCWKPCYVRLHGTTLLVYNDKKDSSPIQELLLQATYSLSDTTLQAYDVFGKIHTVKLQFAVYKEKVGIRPGQISRLVDGHITKYGLPLEHTAQCTVLLKFGSLNAAELQSFVTSIEDILFKCQISRTTKPVYKQDEVQIHCYDEYSAFVDKEGTLSDQKARVRLFCLAFLTGSPHLEIGLNDRRRQGKEIVRRKDILPMYTERWIRFEALEFHSIVNKTEFEKEQVITLSPPDGCFFEIMRFRVRPPRNREKAMSVKAIMKIAGSKVEIRIEAMAAAQIQRTRGSDERRQIPCEDIAIRFPIPEAWIYLFREERHWGVGSIHSKKLRPGKVKNLKDRLLGAVQTSEANLIECAIGEAKYEHVYRSLVWRIPRLPEKHHAAYKSHLLKCRFELSSFDLMPEEFLPRCELEFTMPLATVSNTVVRSVSVEAHEDADRVEKFVRYVAKYNYKVEIDYLQCANLDLDMADPSVNPEAAAAPVPELHQPAFHPDQNAELQQGYRIDFNEAEMGHSNRRDDSSSDDEPDSHKMPIIQIDMKNYGY